MIAVRTQALPVGDAVRSLLYLDGHLFLNRLRTIRRDPKRLWLWLLFIVFLLFAFGQRILIGRHAPGFSSHVATILSPVATFIPGVALLYIGLAVALTKKAVALFQSAADARFLCGSTLPPRLVIFWLYFRLLRRFALQLPALAFWFIFLATSVSGAISGIVRFWAAIGLLLAMPLTLNLPLVKLRAGRPLVAPLLGTLLIALGVASLVAAGLQLGHRVVPLASVLLLVPPGSWMVSGFTGQWSGIAALAVTDGLALALSVAVSRDVYPEVWQSSLRMIAVRRLMRERGGLSLSARERREALRGAGVVEGPRRPGKVVSRAGRRVPAGAWTLLWKEWLATTRMRGGLRLPLGLAAVAIVVGWMLGGGFGHVSPAIMLNVLILPIYLVFFINVFMSFRIGVDLRNPLWWLSSASLRARLFVLTLGRELRQLIPILVGLLAAAIAARSWLVFAIGGAGFAVFIWSLQAMGIGVYTVIPAPGDLRGPGQLLRVFLLFVLLVPPLILFGIGAALTRHLSIGFLLGGACLAAEGAALLVFASYRLEGNGLAFAQAERR